jgi:hypothetical protein
MQNLLIVNVREKLAYFGPARQLNFGSIAPCVYTSVLAKRSQSFRLADGLAADSSPEFGQHPVTAPHANLT